MRLIFAVLGMSFGLFSCAPKTNSSGSDITPTVDASSYNGLVSSKWCQPKVTTFYLTWTFLKNGAVVMTETTPGPPPTDILTKNKTWYLQGSTLHVRETSGAETLRKNISFEMSLDNGTVEMVWTDPANATSEPLRLTGCN